MTRTTAGIRHKAMEKKMKMVPRYKAKGRQSGYGLIELMLSVLVIAIVIGGVVATYFLVNSGASATRHQQQLLSLVGGVKDIYRTPTYAGVSAAQLIQTKKAPPNMVSGTGGSATLTNPWSGTITIAATNVGAGTDNGFIITTPQIPTSECNSIVSALETNFTEIAVNGTTVKDQATPLNTQTLTTACAANVNVIALTSI